MADDTAGTRLLPTVPHVRTGRSRSRKGDRKRSFDEVSAALRASGGVIATAAIRLGVNRQRVYDWINADPELKAVCVEIREETLDLAEDRLLQAISAGSEKSVHFFLDRIGRDRGYGTKVSVAGTPGEPPIGVAVKPDLSNTTQDDRDALRAILERAAAAKPGD